MQCFEGRSMHEVFLFVRLQCSPPWSNMHQENFGFSTADVADLKWDAKLLLRCSCLGNTLTDN